MIVIIQNDPIVPPGLLDGVLRMSGAPFGTIRAFAGELISNLDNVGAMVVLGGTMSVYETSRFPFLEYVSGCIREALAREIPFLGICLGGQLLAKILGGNVHLQANGEQGCHRVSLTDTGKRDTIFRGMPEELVSFQWHNDSFDLPPQAVHLAASSACPYQAFRYGKAAYGLQFHPEINREIVLEWSSATSTRQAEIMATFLEAEAVYRAHSLTLLENFLGLALDPS